MTFIFTLVYNIKLLCLWVFIYSTSKQYQIFWITLYLGNSQVSVYNGPTLVFNILRMNGQNLTKFCIHIIIDKIYHGIVNHNFSQIATEFRPLIDVRNQFVQYLENVWTEFN